VRPRPAQADHAVRSCGRLAAGGLADFRCIQLGALSGGGPPAQAANEKRKNRTASHSPNIVSHDRLLCSRLVLCLTGLAGTRHAWALSRPEPCPAIAFSHPK